MLTPTVVVIVCKTIQYRVVKCKYKLVLVVDNFLITEMKIQMKDSVPIMPRSNNSQNHILSAP